MKVIAPLTGHAHVVGLTGSPGVGKSTVTGALVRGLPGPGPARRRAGGRPVVAVQRRGAAGGPGADAGPRHRRPGVHPLDGQPRAPGRAVLGHAAGGAHPGRGRLRRRADRDRRASARPRSRSRRSPTPRWSSSRRAWATPSRRRRPGILEIADVFAVNKSDRPGRPGGGQGPAHDAGDGAATARATGSRRSSATRPRPARASPISPPARQARATGSPSRASGTRGAWPGRGRRSPRSRVGELRQRMGGLPGESRLDELAGAVAAGRARPVLRRRRAHLRLGPSPASRCPARRLASVPGSGQLLSDVTHWQVARSGAARPAAQPAAVAGQRGRARPRLPRG